MNSPSLPARLIAMLLLLVLPSSRLGVALGDRAGPAQGGEESLADSSLETAAVACLPGGKVALPPSPGPSLPCEHEDDSCVGEQSGSPSLEEQGAASKALRLPLATSVEPFFDFDSYVLSRAYFPTLLRPPIA